MAAEEGLQIVDKRQEAERLLVEDLRQFLRDHNIYEGRVQEIRTIADYEFFIWESSEPNVKNIKSADKAEQQAAIHRFRVAHDPPREPDLSITSGLYDLIEDFEAQFWDERNLAPLLKKGFVYHPLYYLKKSLLNNSPPNILKKNVLTFLETIQRQTLLEKYRGFFSEHQGVLVELGINIFSEEA